MAVFSEIFFGVIAYPYPYCFLIPPNPLLTPSQEKRKSIGGVKSVLARRKKARKKRREKEKKKEKKEKNKTKKKKKKKRKKNKIKSNGPGGVSQTSASASRSGASLPEGTPQEDSDALLDSSSDSDERTARPTVVGGGCRNDPIQCECFFFLSSYCSATPCLGHFGIDVQS